MRACVCLHLSVACFDPVRERKGIGSPKLAGWKPIIRVSREIIYRSTDQRSRSPGRLMVSRTMQHIGGRREFP